MEANDTMTHEQLTYLGHSAFLVNTAAATSSSTVSLGEPSASVGLMTSIQITFL